VGARRPAINGGSVRRFRGVEGPGSGVGRRRCLDGEGRRRTGAGKPGRRRRGAGAGGRRGERGAAVLRKKEIPTGGPHLSARGREREGGGGVGRVGRKLLWAGGLGWVDRLDLFCFFSFPFLFKSFSNQLNSKLFHLFKFNTNLFKYFKTFRKLFQTHFF
jgi:hypothetical protein